MPEQENKPTGLAIADGSKAVLAQTSQALAVTDRLLVPLRERKRQELIEFLVRNPRIAIGALSRSYQWNSNLLDSYFEMLRYEDWISMWPSNAAELKADWLEWLSYNPKVQWSSSLIERFQGSWYWPALSSNQAIPWSEDLIVRFERDWNWRYLSQNEALPWSESLIGHFQSKWTWGELSRNEGLPWSEALIHQFRDKWSRTLLCDNKALPWSVGLLKQYEDRWDWSRLSSNPGLPWSELLIDSL